MSDSELEFPNRDMTGQGAVTFDKMIEDAAFVSRFMSRLLTDMAFLKADRVTLKTEPESIKVSLRQGDNEIRTSNIESRWFPVISQWLCERFSLFGGHVQHVMQSRPSPESAAFDFTCAVRVETDLIQVRVRKNTHLNGSELISLSAFNSEPLLSVIARLELSDTVREQVVSLFNNQTGFMVVAAPDENSLAFSKAAILSLTVGLSTRAFSVQAIKVGLAQVSKNQLIVIPMRSDDVLEAALRLRGEGIDLSSDEFRGVLCQGFVRRVCSWCAREAVPEQGRVALLPEGLKLSPSTIYLVGRGCEKCGHSGYGGFMAIQSLFVAGHRAHEMLASGSNIEGLIDELYAGGTRPLLEDGIRKVEQGKLTLESLFELVKTVPAGYMKFYTGQKPSFQSRSILPDMTDDSGMPLLSEEIRTMPGAGKLKRPSRPRPLLMVVEDNADQRTILEMVLKSANYDLLLAVDGEDALSKLRKDNPPDLIIVDLMMPRMDGRELVSRLKIDPVWAEIPVLILTVVSDTDKEYDLLDLGADDYCEKTIQRKILLKRVENLVRRARRQ